MKKIILALFIISVYCSISLAEDPKIYQLVEVYSKADINYEFIKTIDTIGPPYPLGGSFQIGDIPVVEGKYHVCKFINTFYAHRKSGDKAVFHDLLILKVNDENKIQDAYHYTLEWQDVPSYDLYRLNKKNVYLEGGLDIRKLNLTNREGRKLDQGGILDNAYQGKLYF
jgi:hypothetical protein